MKYQFVYLNVVAVAVCLNELDFVCLNGWAGQGNLPGGSLKYLFVYLKICIFKCSYRSYTMAIPSPRHTVHGIYHDIPQFD